MSCLILDARQPTNTCKYSPIDREYQLNNSEIPFYRNAAGKIESHPKERMAFLFTTDDV
jgi:hypothetical protein